MDDRASQERQQPGGDTFTTRRAEAQPRIGASPVRYFDGSINRRRKHTVNGPTDAGSHVIDSAPAGVT